MSASNPFYQEILSRELSRRIGANPRYSMRAFARALDVDVATLSRIISRKTVPHMGSASKIANKLSLSKAQRNLFLKSVAEEKGLHLLKSQDGSGEGWNNFDEDSSFELFEDWFYIAILELVDSEGFKNDSQWISKELGISATQAKLATNRLIQGGFLQLSGNKLKRLFPQQTTTQKNKTNHFLKRYQKQILEMSVGSLENDSIELRVHTGMTMSIDPSKIEEARKLIEDCNRKICELLESGKKKQVYQLSVSLFPLQKRGKL